MEDMISRKALCEYALNQKDKSITPNDIMRFPSAQPEKRTEERTETHTCDCISRQAAIDVLDRNHILGQGLLNDTLDHIADAIMALPSAQPERTEYIPDTKAVPSKRDCVDLAERVTATFYDQEHEEWTQKSVTIADVLDSVCDDYTILPSTYPDLSEYSDKLWRNAYERGRAEAQDEKVRCKDCRYRDPEDHKCDCGHDIIWQLPRDDKWYCADAERRTDEQDSE